MQADRPVTQVRQAEVQQSTADQVAQLVVHLPQMAEQRLPANAKAVPVVVVELPAKQLTHKGVPMADSTAGAVAVGGPVSTQLATAEQVEMVRLGLLSSHRLQVRHPVESMGRHDFE